MEGIQGEGEKWNLPGERIEPSENKLSGWKEKFQKKSKKEGNSGTPELSSLERTEKIKKGFIVLSLNCQSKMWEVNQKRLKGNGQSIQGKKR